jgi:hypothetical protein
LKIGQRHNQKREREEGGRCRTYKTMSLKNTGAKILIKYLQTEFNNTAKKIIHHVTSVSFPGYKCDSIYANQ